MANEGHVLARTKSSKWAIIQAPIIRPRPWHKLSDSSMKLYIHLYGIPFTPPVTPLEHLARELGVEPARLRAALERVLFGG